MNEPDIYDDLISRRINSSDAEKFAEVCPCPCNGVAWGVLWSASVSLLPISIKTKSQFNLLFLTFIFLMLIGMKGNDLIHIPLRSNVPWTCHPLMRYVLLHQNQISYLKSAVFSNPFLSLLAILFLHLKAGMYRMQIYFSCHKWILYVLVSGYSQLGEYFCWLHRFFYRSICSFSCIELTWFCIYPMH